VDGVEEITGHVIGRDREGRAPVLPLAESVPGQDEHAPRSDGARRHEVRRLVADQRGLREVEPVVGGGAVEESGLGLATVTKRPVTIYEDRGARTHRASVSRMPIFLKKNRTLRL